MIRLSLTTDSPLLQTVIDSYLKRTGKQIRPILSLLSAGVYGEVNDKVICAAASIEMLHNASLIHDDVLDESQKRRGMATINSVWDNQVAVLVGDYFVSRALNCAVATGDLRIIRAMAQLGTSLSRGEIDQIDHARKHDISEESYFSIIGQKTASLFSTCVEAGCYAAGVTDEQMKPLLQYAAILGDCFQIKDDIFDYFDDTNVGKPTGNDLREGKVTLPLIHALEVSDPEVRREMEQILDKGELSTADINNLIDFAKRNGGIEYAETKMNELRNEARKQLKLLPQNRCTESLATIFDYIIDRKI